MNGRPATQIGEFRLIDGRIFARRTELAELGIQALTVTPLGTDDLVPLAELPGFTYRLDAVSQVIYLTATNDNLVPSVLKADLARRSSLRVDSATGATANYDFTGTSSGSRVVLAGFVDLRAFSPLGVVSSGFLMSTSGRGVDAARTGIVRLDTGYSIADPATLRRLRVGDFITGGLGWTRPVRLAGVQFSYDFALRPDLVTFALPSVSGSAAVPSTVDVLVNGTKLFSREVEAGPFTIPQLPVVTGAGTISTVVTDALGRQTATLLPIYATSALLAPGLQSLSAQVGRLRRNYGLLSNDYRNLATSVTYRRGLSDVVTVEGSAEGGADLVMAGAGAVFNLNNLAIVSAALAGSTGGKRSGRQLALSVQRLGTRLSLTVSATVASRHYRDLAVVNGDPVSRLTINASAGLALGRFGSLGIAFVGIKRDAALIKDRVVGPFSGHPDAAASLPFGGSFYLEPAQRAQVATASYSVQIRGLSIFMTGFRDFARRGGSGMLGGISLAFGDRGSIGINAGVGSGSTSIQGQVSQSAVSVGDWGYQLNAASGNNASAFGEARFKAPFGLVSAGLDYSGKQTTVRGTAQGSVSLVAGQIFASNTIYDSFAVVETNGTAGVHVQSENRDVGVTDGRGRLLVPDLRAFDINNLSISAADIPLDVVLETATREVRPQDRSGVVVRFTSRTSRAALLRLVDSRGAPIALGSTATANGNDPVPVGYNGEAYMSDLTARNAVSVKLLDGGHCSLNFDLVTKPGEIPIVGPVTCIGQQP